MKFKRFVAAMLLCTPMALLAGCSDDDDDDGVDELELSEIADIWTATSFTYTSESNPSQSVDLVADANGTFILEIEEDGDYQFSSNIPGVGNDIESGDVELTGNGRIRFDPSDANPENANLTVTSNGNMMTLSFDEASYDFDDDGDEEAADATVVLVRS